MKLFQWHYVLSVSLVGFTLFQPASTRANIGSGPITCSQSGIANTTGGFAFGKVDPFSSKKSTSMTIDYECKGGSSTSGDKSASALVCFTFGPLGLTDSHRNMPGPNNSSMAFNLFSDVNLSKRITYTQPLKDNFTQVAGATRTRSITVHAKTLAGQTMLLPGPYFLQGQQVFMTVNSVNGSIPPANCTAPVDGENSSTYKLPYTSSASVLAHCSITTFGVLDLGSVVASTTATSESSVNPINVTCTNNTSYNIGLAPSNGNEEGAGDMSGADDKIKLPYQLKSAVGTPWGNNGSTYGTLTNGVKGKAKNGIAQTHTVYVTVPSTDFKPDNYSDTVTISVNY